jgi:hypothetical protein
VPGQTADSWLGAGGISSGKISEWLSCRFAIMTSATRSVWTSSGGGLLGAGPVLAGWGLWDGDGISATLGLVMLTIGVLLLINGHQRDRKAAARPE